MEYYVGVFAILALAMGILLYLLVLLWVWHPTKFNNWKLRTLLSAVWSRHLPFVGEEPARKGLYDRRKYRAPPAKLSACQLETIPEEEEEC